MILVFLTKSMSRDDLRHVLEDEMLRQIGLSTYFSIKALSLYAPVVYLDKELDKNYYCGDLSPNEQEQKSSEQSGTDDLWHDKEIKRRSIARREGTLQPEMWIKD